MLQQLAQNTTDTWLVIAMMLLAFAAFGLLCWQMTRGSDSHFDAMAHAPLNDDAGNSTHTGEQTEVNDG